LAPSPIPQNPPVTIIADFCPPGPRVRPGHPEL